MLKVAPASEITAEVVLESNNPAHFETLTIEEMESVGGGAEIVNLT